MQTVNAYSQTMRCNYQRGIMLSGFSLAFVNASKVVEGCDFAINRALIIPVLAGHHRWNSNAAFVCSGPSPEYTFLSVLYPSLGNFPTTSQRRRQPVKINKYYLGTVPLR